MSHLPTPEPDIDPETEEFWRRTTEGELLLRHCTDCERIYHYPRTLCPDCFSDDTEWIEASGVGTIYSYTVTRQARGPYGDAAPYVLAYVELEEGPRVMTNIVDCDPEDLAVGQTVEVLFEEANDDAAIFRFTPRE